MKSRFATSVIFLGMLTAPLYAQTGSWSVDSSHSDAQLSIDAAINKTNQTIVLGSARVSGTLNLDKSDPMMSTFAFAIYPASSSSPAIDESGRRVSEEGPNVTNYTLITFHSDKISPTSDGNLKVTGKLTVTHLERQAVLTPNEAYAGPVYGPTIVQKSSREESFIIALPASGVAAGQTSAKAEIFASGNVIREDFPQLVNAILITNWPAVVQDEQCDTPSNVGDGYSGSVCSGSVVDTPSVPSTYAAAGIGEDYPGPGNYARFGNSLTIAIRMQLVGERVELSPQVGD